MNQKSKKMANETLLTGWEVVKFNAMDHNIEAQKVADHIYDIENKIARQCLGKTFYSALLADATEFEFEQRPGCIGCCVLKHSTRRIQ